MPRLNGQVLDEIVQPIIPPADIRFQENFGKYMGKRNLNVGAALRRFTRFIHLDCDPRTQPDILHDLEVTPLPFPDNEFDCIMGSHVFEHIKNFVPLMEEFHRILKPGGYLIGITPYMTSNDAWACPHHVRAFDENTWYYFDQNLYTEQEIDSAGYGAWQNYRANFKVEQVILIPYEEQLQCAQENPVEFEFRKKHYFNIIREIHGILRKV